MMEVYFDNAATTKPDPRVVEKMTKFLKEDFGNPSSTHKFGRKARVAVEESREIIAEFLNADPSEIYFTSSGTEADNMALFGIAKTESKESGRNKIIATAGDHHAVIESIERLSEEGFQTELIPLRKDSSVDLESLSETIDKETSLISAIHYNNETGVINPIEEISNMKNEHAFYFHTDAVQSFGKTKIDVRKFNLDALSFSGHKIHGPKGIGGLYVKSGTPMDSLLFGGSQERNRRGGTENVPGIAGLAEAVKIASAEMEENLNHVSKLRQSLIDGISSEFNEEIKINDGPNFSPYVLSITFRSEYFKNDIEAMLMYLDINGIAASNGAACASGTIKPSHVLLASGLNEKDAAGTIRFSFSKFNRIEEVDYTVDILKKMAEKFRI